MLYHLFLSVKHSWSSLTDPSNGFWVLGCMFLVSFGLSLLMGKGFIAISRQFFRSKTRQWLPDAHRQKDHTPTAGGVFIIVSALFTCFLGGILFSWDGLICLLSLISFGYLGFWDDWGKIRRHKGITAAQKIVFQWLFAACMAFILVYIGTPTSIKFTWLGELPIGIFYIPWAMLVIVACSNAVNLTDGLDGLAAGSLIPNFLTFAIIMAVGLTAPANLTGALTAVIVAGSCLGFYYYNRRPAHIFMGDVGSLSLGAFLGVLALRAKAEILLILTGAVFVAEVLSVILQVLSVRYMGKRIFKMSPIHHHFELTGWSEGKITCVFTAITIVACLLGLVLACKN